VKEPRDFEHNDGDHAWLAGIVGEGGRIGGWRGKGRGRRGRQEHVLTIIIPSRGESRSRGGVGGACRGDRMGERGEGSSRGQWGARTIMGVKLG